MTPFNHYSFEIQRHSLDLNSAQQELCSGKYFSVFMGIEMTRQEGVFLFWSLYDCDEEGAVISDNASNYPSTAE